MKEAHAHSSSVFPNAVVRSKGDRQTYCGHEIARCRDRSSLNYRLPFEKVAQRHNRRASCSRSIKGYIVDWDAQKAIWDGMFLEFLKVVPYTLGHRTPPHPTNANRDQADISECSILITEPYFNLPQIQRIYDQFVFEEYGFQSYYRCTRSWIFASQEARILADTRARAAASLIPHGSLFTAPHKTPKGSAPLPPECMLVIDSGFSFTHVVPLISDSIVWNGVKRYGYTHRIPIWAV